ncbi:MAG: hypothetical protein JXA99_10580 [Candidatus Lokiarchaeota archaeon]|nr:hypothetical protein [Candidatus Lokiarchaeota archaeon]
MDEKKNSKSSLKDYIIEYKYEVTILIISSIIISIFVPYDEKIQSFFTMIIAIATIVYVRKTEKIANATIQQAIITEELSKISKKQLMFTERPILETTLYEENNNPLISFRGSFSFDIFVNNIGNGTALNLKNRIYLKFENVLYQLYSEKLSDFSFLKSKGHRTIPITFVNNEDSRNFLLSYWFKDISRRLKESTDNNTLWNNWNTKLENAQKNHVIKNKTDIDFIINIQKNNNYPPKYPKIVVAQFYSNFIGKSYLVLVPIEIDLILDKSAERFNIKIHKYDNVKFIELDNDFSNDEELENQFESNINKFIN